jgi:hypothetical protein
MLDRNAPFTIFRGREIPQTKRHRERTSKYPFPLMDVGDSFDVMAAGEKVKYGYGDKAFNRVSVAARLYGKESGKEFVARKTASDTIGIWRVA